LLLIIFAILSTISYHQQALASSEEGAEDERTCRSHGPHIYARELNVVLRPVDVILRPIQSPASAYYVPLKTAKVAANAHKSTLTCLQTAIYARGWPDQASKPPA